MLVVGGTLDAGLGDLADDYDVPTIDFEQIAPFRSVLVGGPGRRFEDRRARRPCQRRDRNDTNDAREGADVAHGDDGDDRVETSVIAHLGPMPFAPEEGGDHLFGDAGQDTLVTLRAVVRNEEGGARDCFYGTGRLLDGGGGDDVFLNGYGDEPYRRAGARHRRLHQPPSGRGPVGALRHERRER